MSSDPDPNPDTVSDEESFLTFVRALAADNKLAEVLAKADPSDGAPRGWQNATIEQFLEAAVAWAEDSRFGRGRLPDEGVSPWRRFAAFLYAGKIYE